MYLEDDSIDNYLFDNSNCYPSEEYYINGIRHRDFDLPAVVFSSKNTYLMWYKDGQIHRENNKPAIINGNFLYYFNKGKIYKSEIKFEKKYINWIVNNPFKIAITLFLIVVIIFSL